MIAHELHWQMGLTAAHCAKTLVIASIVGSPSLRQCARLLLPGMIESVAKVAIQDEATETRVQIVAEIWKAFAALFTSASEENSELFDSTSLLIMAYIPTRATPVGCTPTYNDIAHGSNPDITISIAYADNSPGACICHSISTCI